eukprot:GILJ01007753.1.p1 GENE.GILJ01007753.1~~GILJ01007753.1.p1  ORF type:complete len:298 (-),score=58.67 GILJ01007753.1:171-1064(-)
MEFLAHAALQAQQKPNGKTMDLKRKKSSTQSDDEEFDDDDSQSSQTFDDDNGTPAKRRKAGRGGEKSNKGLRHFSMKVCEKVQQKTRTTYVEVADELVAEFAKESLASPVADQAHNDKNIRRRVYDALNVLMAMDIITKEKKEIKWRGLPAATAATSTKDLESLLREKAARQEAIEKKKMHLQELVVQQLSLRRLIQRNALKGATPEESKIQLPFIVVNTSKSTIIECQMSEDRADIFFNFSLPFEIHDDNEILKRMSMHKTTMDDLVNLVPKQFLPHLPTSFLNSVKQQSPTHSSF